MADFHLHIAVDVVNAGLQQLGNRQMPLEFLFPLIKVG
jgi:hypothetical protein